MAALIWHCVFDPSSIGLLMKHLGRVLHYFRPDASRIAVALALILLGTLMNLLKPWPLALIVDSVLGTKPLPKGLVGLMAGWEKITLLAVFAGAMLALHLGQAALSAGANFLLIQTGLRGLARVRKQLFHWLQRLSVRYHQGARQGDVIYRATWDTYAFQTLFQHGLFAFITATLALSLMVVVMWRLNRTLTLAALGTIPVLLLAMHGFGRKMNQYSLAANQSDSRVASLVQQGIAALPLTLSHVSEAQEERRFATQVDEALRQRQAQHGWEVVYIAALAVILGGGLAATVWLGAHQVWAGRLSIGELLVFMAYLGQFYEPLNQLSHVGSTAANARAGTQRVFEILDTPEEVTEIPQARPVRRPGEPTAGAGTLFVRGAVSFDRVSFGYRSEDWVLRDLSFVVQPGEVVALVGPSGAGKTTLLHLLPRFFDPTGGTIQLDGVDLRELRLKELRAQMALVMQDPILLPATIAENIAYGKANANLSEIQAAARAAQAEGFIERLPQQYDTLVGEGAARLSTGEKQRLSLARAFLKNAPILLLDEPTSALDAESEMGLVASLEKLMRGRTTLIVAHRYSTIRRVDKIMVLENGQLTETGPPSRLLQSQGYFARVAGRKGSGWGEQ